MIRPATLVVSVLLIAVTACGIPSDDEPRAIPSAAVPEQVHEPRGTSTSSSVVIPGTAQRETIFLVGGSETSARLTPVEVNIEGTGDPAQLPRRVVERLIETRPEAVGRQGEATNELPSDVRVIDAVMQSDGVLDLNLSGLAGVEGERLKLAMAQIVFTATELPGITGVRFAIDGEPANVQIQSGSALPGTPVSQADYPELDPQQPREAE